jgi:ketosteroid isomerase-like protein
MSEESTTPDPAELLRQVYKALSRRDVDAVMSFLAPDAVYDLSDVGIGTFEGLEAIRGFVGDWLGSYDDLVQEAEEILDLGHGVVFAVWRESGRLVGTQERPRLPAR